MFRLRFKEKFTNTWRRVTEIVKKIVNLMNVFIFCSVLTSKLELVNRVNECYPLKSF